MEINPLIPPCIHLLHRYTPTQVNVIRQQAYIMSHGVKNFLKFSVAWRNCINTARIQPFLFLLYVPTTSRQQENKMHPPIFYQLRGKLCVSILTNIFFYKYISTLFSLLLQLFTLLYIRTIETVCEHNVFNIIYLILMTLSLSLSNRPVVEP